MHCFFVLIFLGRTNRLNFTAVPTPPAWAGTPRFDPPGWGGRAIAKVPWPLSQGTSGTEAARKPRMPHFGALLAHHQAYIHFSQKSFFVSLQPVCFRLFPFSRGMGWDSWESAKPYGWWVVAVEGVGGGGPTTPPPPLPVYPETPIFQVEISVHSKSFPSEPKCVWGGQNPPACLWWGPRGR